MASNISSCPATFSLLYALSSHDHSEDCEENGGRGLEFWQDRRLSTSSFAVMVLLPEEKYCLGYVSRWLLVLSQTRVGDVNTLNRPFSSGIHFTHHLFDTTIWQTKTRYLFGLFFCQINKLNSTLKWHKKLYLSTSQDPLIQSGWLLARSFNLY